LIGQKNSKEEDKEEAKGPAGEATLQATRLAHRKT